ncbi:hypothetical protein BURK1_00667 [Burkholderiales bacterium]|nr:hypothetical protein BURK1_00667 [Burkholderiales bacterium]
MRHRRPLRRLIALVAVVAIVAAQSAAAAYACARSWGAPLPASAAPVPCVEHLATGATQAGWANLCVVHCQDGSVTVAAIPPMLAPAPGPMRVAAAGDASYRDPPAALPDARGAAPPPRSRYCRLQL